jgi:formylglycine-generating enzyme required for sulfatase activity
MDKYTKQNRRVWDEWADGSNLCPWLSLNLGAPGRGLRGGSWNNNTNNIRSANRNRNEPGNWNNNNGFRCSRSLFINLGSEFVG